MDSRPGETNVNKLSISLSDLKGLNIGQRAMREYVDTFFESETMGFDMHSITKRKREERKQFWITVCGVVATALSIVLFVIFFHWFTWLFYKLFILVGLGVGLFAGWIVLRILYKMFFNKG